MDIMPLETMYFLILFLVSFCSITVIPFLWLSVIGLPTSWYLKQMHLCLPKMQVPKLMIGLKSMTQEILSIRGEGKQVKIFWKPERSGEGMWGKLVLEMSLFCVNFWCAVSKGICSVTLINNAIYIFSVQIVILDVYFSCIFL